MILYLCIFTPSLYVVVVETNILAANTSNASKSSASVSRLLSYLFIFRRNIFFVISRASLIFLRYELEKE